MKWIHPRFATLEAFALDSSKEQRISAHLAGCVQCQDTVRALRTLQTTARDAVIPPMSAGLRDRVLADAVAGDRRIIPASVPDEAVPHTAPSRIWLAFAAAAAIVAAIVLSPKQSLVAEPTAGSLSIVQASFDKAPAISVEYTPGALMENAKSVILRVSAYQAEQFFQPDEKTYTLTRASGKKFSARVALPEGTVFAAYSVASEDGAHIDDNDARGWEEPIKGASSLPLFDGLFVQYFVNARSNWERAAASTNAMFKYYPENPAALRFAMMSDMELAGSARHDSVIRAWKPRVDSLNRRLLATPAPDATKMWELAMVGSLAKDTAITNYWRRRMIREFPRDAGTIQQRVFAVFGSGGKRDEVLRELDKLYRETGGQSIQLLSDAFDMATKSGDSATVALWGGRLKAFGSSSEGKVAFAYASIPAFREEGMTLIRKSLASLAPIPADDWQASVRKGITENRSARGQWQLLSLGQALLETGRVDAARDTLRRAASLAWDVKSIRALGDAELAAHDTARAMQAYAWLAADSRTGRARADTLRGLLGAAGRSPMWDKAFADGQSLIDAMTLRRSIHRGFEPAVTFSSLAGQRRSLAEAIGKAPIAIVAFVSLNCGPSIADLPSLSAVTAEMKERGIPVVVLVEDAASETVQLALERNGFKGAVMFDDKGVVSRSMRQAGTPQYFVVENGRSIRFDTRRMEDTKPFIDALARTR